MVEQLDSLCRHSSEREQAAAEVEREATLVKVLEYLEHSVGEVFDGVIASISSSGLQVMLPVMVKGFIPIGTLGDEHFICDFERQVLTPRILGCPPLSRSSDSVFGSGRDFSPCTPVDGCHGR